MLGSDGPGEYVRITVSDSVVGIGEDTRSQIFDPFFTTKGPDKGTGLGFSTVYGVVENNGGLVTVHSDLGEGTSISIHSPCSTNDAEVGTGQLPPARTGRRILLVEDNDDVRALGSRILTDAGYDVLEAGVVGDALERVHEYGSSIDLLVTDNPAPETNANVLADAISKRLPDLPVVYVSGAADARIEHELDPSGRSRSVAKPFRPDQLLDATRSLLEGEQAVRHRPAN